MITADSHAACSKCLENGDDENGLRISLGRLHDLLHTLLRAGAHEELWVDIAGTDVHLDVSSLRHAWMLRVGPSPRRLERSSHIVLV